MQPYKGIKRTMQSGKEGTKENRLMNNRLTFSSILLHKDFLVNINFNELIILFLCISLIDVYCFHVHII